MNFMKNSLFQRNLEQEREEEMPEEGGVLAVWGSPSSGKTVVSVKLAEHLAKKKRNVILILADMITPPLPYLCAPSDIEQERSLGSILAASVSFSSFSCALSLYARMPSQAPTHTTSRITSMINCFF